MYSILNNIENTRINSISEINDILSNLNKEYKDSTHICYAYIIDNKEKCFDDGEPSATAGLPILNVLKKNNLSNILAVVIRYFGGIKLGVGGLSHAYSSSIIEALKLSSIIELTIGYLIEIEFSYDSVKLIDYILYDKKIIDKIYKDNIIYKFYLTEDELKIIPELEKISIHVSIKDKTLVFLD